METDPSPNLTDQSLPNHIAIIMDGNGRWAKARGLSRPEGHAAGAESVRRITRYAGEKGIGYLTLYAFSTENWSRPAGEVNALMELLASYVQSELPELMQRRVRLRFIGDPSRLSEELQSSLRQAEQTTAGNDGLRLTIAVNYGGRDELTRAARAIAAGPNRFDEAAFAANLDTAGMPDPDMIIRTAGEQRVSNFLIWQAAYAELYFTATLWPDFAEPDFDAALAEYVRRIRKFGGL